MPKLRQMDLAWPIWRNPLGSGGKRVTMAWCFPEARSSAMIWRMKSSGLLAISFSEVMGRYSVLKSLSSSEKVIDTLQAGQHFFPAQSHEDIKHRGAGQLAGEHGPH